MAREVFALDGPWQIALDRENAGKRAVGDIACRRWPAGRSRPRIPGGKSNQRDAVKEGEIESIQGEWKHRNRPDNGRRSWVCALRKGNRS